jgi:hypothetical protein
MGNYSAVENFYKKYTYVFYENSGTLVAAATKRFLHSESVPPDSRFPEFVKQMKGEVVVGG